MRFHTDLHTPDSIELALTLAKGRGVVTSDVIMTTFDVHGSRSHARAYEIQLGTHDKSSLPAGARRARNGGTTGARRFKQWRGDAEWIYAATWDEWGWFIAFLFDVEPAARFGPYKGRDDFHAQTRGQFRLTTTEV